MGLWEAIQECLFSGTPFSRENTWNKFDGISLISYTCPYPASPGYIWVILCFFQNKICPKENKIQGKYDTREQIKCRKQITEGCLLGSHDLPGLWLSKTNCWMPQSRELIYKLESLDQLSQATFSWRLHLYLHPCLAMLKERDYQERLEWWLSLWPHVFLRSKERDAQVPGEGCSVSAWQAWRRGEAEVLNIVMMFVGIRLLWKLLTVTI